MAVYYGEARIDQFVREVFFPLQTKGTFIEIGAAGPEFLSISLHFRKSGWRVISVEPNPYFCSLHRERGHEMLQYACGDHDEDDVEFELAYSQTEGDRITFESYSALRILEEYKNVDLLAFGGMKTEKIKVKLRKIDTLLAQHYQDIDSIDILSVDVEGWELQVLDGISMERYRPKVLIVENYLGCQEYVSYMKNKGYILAARRFPNDVYTRNGVFPKWTMWEARVRNMIYILSEYKTTLRGLHIASEVERARKSRTPVTPK
ncbi:MAG: hypothetical protein A2Z40_00865 [Deltaproteobacteria bacterium RBG_19FT_COMBO_60_16]|nr:MAG: hypothetical protein A2Z13_02515 [Deltaproteobacteria bacterium RBG_16_64_85]OGQ00739.1 MAG: hypothetical protein A2Z40_00865 [Deltaproteobacteria bacterium RBG_19FT_COMBO_60_16]